MCLHVYQCVGVHTLICEYKGQDIGQYWVASHLFIYLLTYIYLFHHSLSSNYSHSGRLGSQQDLRSHLSLFPPVLGLQAHGIMPFIFNMDTRDMI